MQRIPRNRGEPNESHDDDRVKSVHATRQQDVAMFRNGHGHIHMSAIEAA